MPRPADLKLIGVLETPKDLSFDGVPFGGLSGIDYDPASGDWLMISDDRSDKAPARFYTARLDYDAGGIRSLKIKGVTSLRREDGSLFASSKGQGERADAEALRLDPRTRQVVWSTEGDPDRGFDPALRRTDRLGAPLGRIPLPPGLGFGEGGVSGARPNKTIEGLSFSPDGDFLWMAMEAPLIQDGPMSTVSATGLTRITRLDREGRVAAQYAYRLDPVQAATVGRGDNGISEILAIDDRRLLVLERSGVETAPGRFAYHCRLYAVDVRDAQDVAVMPSLAVRGVRPLAKRLLVNFVTLAQAPTSNLEAMAWGPDLPDGSRTLVLAADDNFSRDALGQILVFSVQ
uniref:Phytase-like domain-containing protein n=1 Tax=Caulobacter sp. (strain K31) TaxID=366602 RepID=B0T4E7_CAUSK